MREYPVGSVCVIVNKTGTVFEHFVGKECAILEGVAEREGTLPSGSRGKVVGYKVDVQGRDKWAIVCHENLKLKKFPGQLQSWLTEKMDKLLTPNPYIVAEEV